MGESGEARQIAAAGLWRGGEADGQKVRFRQLKPRPGRPSGEVASDQARRIRAAMVELVDERGYEAVSVRAIVARAGVSTRTFYAQYAGKDECFLAGYDTIVRATARDVLAAANRNAEWDERLRQVFSAFAKAVAARPQTSRVALIASFAAAPSVLERMRHARGLFEALIAESLAVADDGVELPPPIYRGVVSAWAQISRARLLAGREPDLPGDSGALADWVISLRSSAANLIYPENTEGQTPPPLGLAPEYSPSDERTAILRATVRIASRRGFGALTVSAIRAEAGLPRRSFYAHFSDLEDCLLAARELCAGQALALSYGAYLSGPNWPAGICRLTASLFSQFSQDPVLAAMARAEVSSVGPSSIRWRVEQITSLSALFSRSSPVELRPGELAIEASIAAAWSVLDDYLVADDPQRMARAISSASYFLLAPVIGAGAAAEVISHEAMDQGSGRRSEAIERPPRIGSQGRAGLDAYTSRSG